MGKGETALPKLLRLTYRSQWPSVVLDPVRVGMRIPSRGFQKSVFASPRQMVASKKKRSSDPSAALRSLLVEPGTTDDIWDDLLGSIELDPSRRIARALAGRPKYDDRAAALVFAAMLEHAIQIAIQVSFKSKGPQVEALFSYQSQGPLAHFASKVKIGHAMGLFGEEMRGDLDTIVIIRNVFAHARIHVDFKHEAVMAACHQLTVAKHLKEVPITVGHEGKSRRVDVWTARQAYTAAIAAMTNFLGLFPHRPVTDPAIAQNYNLMYRTSLELP